MSANKYFVNTENSIREYAQKNRKKFENEVLSLLTREFIQKYIVRLPPNMFANIHVSPPLQRDIEMIIADEMNNLRREESE